VQYHPLFRPLMQLFRLTATSHLHTVSHVGPPPGDPLRIPRCTAEEHFVSFCLI